MSRSWSSPRELGASSVELVLILSLIVAVAVVPARELMLNYQGDAVLTEDISTAYQALQSKTVAVSEMGVNGYLRSRSLAEINTALHDIASELHTQTNLDNFCAVAVEINSGGGMTAIADQTDDGTNCLAGALPANITTAIGASINPYSGTQYTVVVFNTSPQLSQSFALLRTSTTASSSQ